MEKETILIPKYMNEFSCVGSECEDTCCSSWQINIDQKTYNKYEGFEKIESMPSVLRHLKVIEPSPSSQQFAEIQLNENLLCPLLNENKLCSIHLQFGEEHLSNICVTYPRVSNRVNGIYQKSATLSCPEAARLALLNPNGILFEEIQEVVEENRWDAIHIDTRQPSKQRHKYFLELQTITFEVLQNRTYALQERLLILSLLIEELQDCIGVGNAEEIPSVIASFREQIAAGTISERFAGLPISIADQMQLVRKSIDMRLFAGVDHKRYLQCIMESLDGLKYAGDTINDESIGAYQSAYQTYYQPFMTEHEYILENYLINNMFKGMFPSRKDFFEEYMMYIVHYALIKFHIIGMMNYYKEAFNVNHILKLIQSFSRNFEHAPNYVRQFLKWMKDNGQMNLNTAAILIQNEALVKR
ncbi:lysine-N-methylase [Paenibacillus sp. LMG 31456]|uniref:Lysine-N-methylase n=1 Tax=Paenibacillus foliorum TaxID=2654974 RepID=A0A972GK54_9BACL|nr:flagellin lysine-N-methylase [Paenibacillus foliorum]NOU92239.1 lysine-N-methylase [Paenibacillus foliorum]